MAHYALLMLLAGVGIQCFLDRAQAKDKTRFKYFTIVMMVMLAEILILVVLAHFFQNKFDVVKDLRLNSAGHMILLGSFVLTFLKSADREVALHLRKIHLVLALAFVAADLLTHLPKQNPTIPAEILAMPMGQDEARPVHGVIPFDHLARMVHQDQVRKRNPVEVHRHRVGPVEFGMLRIPDRQMPGKAEVELQLGERATGRDQSLLAVEAQFHVSCALELLENDLVHA